jgi:hypothetical protein
MTKITPGQISAFPRSTSISENQPAKRAYAATNQTNCHGYSALSYHSHLAVFVNTRYAKI